MSYYDFLTIGRQIGYDNLVQIQNLRRAFKSGEIGKASAQFVLPSQSQAQALDEFVKAGIDKEAASKFMAVLKKCMSKSMSDNNGKGIISVVMNRFSKNAGSFSADGIGISGNEIVSTARVNILKNDAAVRVKLQGATEGGTKASYDFVMPKDAQFPVDDIIKSINYTEEGNIGKINLNFKKGMQSFKAALDAPKELLDSLAEVSNSNHSAFKGIKSMKEMVDNYKYLVSDEQKAAKAMDAIMFEVPEYVYKNSFNSPLSDSPKFS